MANSLSQACRVGTVVAIFVGVVHFAEADQSSDAVAVLRLAGLSEVRHCWVCREEARLLRQLDRLDGMRGKFLRARRRWRELGDEQAELRIQVAAADKGLKRFDKKIRAAGADAFRRQSLEEQQRKLQQQQIRQRRQLRQRLDGLNEESEITESAIEYAATRARLEAASIALHDAANRSTSWYDSMEPAIGRALASLAAKEGNGARLGPARDYGRILPQQQARLKPLLSDARLPFYRADGRLCVTIVLNESAPATFAIEDDAPISMASSSLLTGAGVAVGPEATRREVHFHRQTVEGPVIQVSALRLGPHTMEPVEFLVLESPNDALGPILAIGELKGFELRWDHERLEVSVSKRSQPADTDL